MATTCFVALQCFQCSTMQVKQQRKSGTKWTCVVCNEKQSVRKVYAQGSAAKDVRKFVQSFNLSRLIMDQQQQQQQQEEEVGGGGCLSNRNKRRSDWSEYLNPDEEQDREMANDMFKKPKLKNQSSGLQTRDEGMEPERPRNTISTGGEEETRKCELKMAVRAPKIKGTTSKWSEYLTEEENEEGPASKLEWEEEDYIAQQGNIDSQTVEEEIHPHFM